MKDKQSFVIEMEPSKAQFLEEIARTHGLPDMGKAMRCLIDYAREHPEAHDAIFDEVHCVDCSDSRLPCTRFPSNSPASARSGPATSSITGFSIGRSGSSSSSSRPGPLTFDLFEGGFDRRMVAWLGLVLAARASGRCADACRASSPRPTSSGSPRIAPTRCTGGVLHAGVGRSHDLRRAEHRGPDGRHPDRPLGARGDLPLRLFPACRGHLAGWRNGWLPRVKRSTAGEGHERRYFYGTVWAVATAQPVLWVLYLILPRTRTSDVIELVAFIGILAFMGRLAVRGRLPRTRPIVPGEFAALDWHIGGLSPALL